MRIVVCVKQILDPRGLTVNRKSEKVFVNREEYRLDPASRAALQVAAAVKAAQTASNGANPPEIIALSLGPDRVDDALREAMAFGADRAILLNDPAFETADAFVAANALAAAIRKMGEFDLIVVGARSLDSGSGELGARLAEALEVPAALNAVSVEATPDGLSVVREFGEMFIRLDAPLPLVLSVVPEAFEPGYANGWRLMDAYKKWTVDVWSAADLGLADVDVQSMAVRREDAFPPERQLGTRMKDARELVAALKRERVI